ncbi:MAG: hypothetical protein AAGB46_13880 [Verrucomicrobiota bacterium]
MAQSCKDKVGLLDVMLKAEGEDALQFLQGQFSNDLGDLGEGDCLYGLWLNRKGKILADSYVLRTGEERFAILSENGERDVVHDRLDEYIIMDDVELAVNGESLPLWVIDKRGEESALGLLGMSIPKVGGFVSSEGAIAFWGQDGYLRIVFEEVDSDRVKRFAEEIAVDRIQVLEAPGLTIENWKSGIFEVGFDILDTDLPQEVGLGERAVSYNKGCYLGQEVMARLHAIGRVRREMVCVELYPESEFELGSIVFDAEEKKRGELRRSLCEGGKRWGSAILNLQAEGSLWVKDTENERRELKVWKRGD